MNDLVRWMNGSMGRLLRGVAGAALIVGGSAVGGAGGVVLIAVGALALVAGATGSCLVAPMSHLPLTEGR